MDDDEEILRLICLGMAIVHGQEEQRPRAGRIMETADRFVNYVKTGKHYA